MKAFEGNAFVTLHRKAESRYSAAILSLSVNEECLAISMKPFASNSVTARAALDLPMPRRLASVIALI